MPARNWRPLCALMVGSLIVISLPAPSQALDLRKTTVNRSGDAQNGQLIELIGAALFTEFDSGPFPAVVPVLVPVISTAVFYTGRTIPSTELNNPPGTSVATTGFSVADHRINLSGWTWADRGPIPTAPIADPAIIFEPGMVTIMAIGRAVHGQKIKITFNPNPQAGLFALETPPPPAKPGGGVDLPSGNGSGNGNGNGNGSPPVNTSGGGFRNPGVRISNEQPPIIIPPSSQPPSTVPSTNDVPVASNQTVLKEIANLDLNVGQMAAIPLNVPGPGEIRVYGNFNGSDAANVVIRDNPEVNLPPVGFVSREAQDVYIIIGGDTGLYAPEQICIDAFDTNDGPHRPRDAPKVMLDSIQESLDGLSYVPAGDDVHIFSQTTTKTNDITGRKTTHLCIDGEIRLKTRSRTTITYYKFIFKIVNSTNEVSIVERIVQVRGISRANG